MTPPDSPVDTDPIPRLTVTAVVLCGGRSRRLGRDKTRAALGDTTVLDHLLDALPTDWEVVAVGAARPTTRSVTWAREDPPGGGPLAATAAGLTQAAGDLVVVIAGDMPFAAPAAARLVSHLLTAIEGDPGLDAVTAVDGDGRPNPLLTAYRTEVVRRALPADPAGRPARWLLERVRAGTLPVPADEALDVDTPEALAEARRRAP